MATILGQRFPIVTLDNKLTVVNYGSNHTYLFNDGTELDKDYDEEIVTQVVEHKGKE